MADRQNELKDWLKQILEGKPFTLSSLPGDASFRRYFRVHYDNRTEILMDAPPEKENTKTFIEIANLLQQAQIRSPKILASDRQKGFLLLEDFGNDLLLDACTSLQVDADPALKAKGKDLGIDQTESRFCSSHYYEAAILLLVNMQKNLSLKAVKNLPIFDCEYILKELDLFKTWFLNAYLALSLDKEEEIELKQFFDLLAKSLDQQPKTFIHRDYHSRNLMILEENFEDPFNINSSVNNLTANSPRTNNSVAGPLNLAALSASSENHLKIIKLGIIDFQDAMQGPLPYDLVSLLKDCYIKWPSAQILEWLRFFYQKAGLAATLSFNTFEEYFHLCGLQRHLKVLGIFSRLYLRDQKKAYLKDLPLTLHYVVTALDYFSQKKNHPAFQNFKQWIQMRVKLP